MREEGAVSEEDILGYADGLLILCTSLAQLRKAIRILNTWSK